MIPSWEGSMKHLKELLLKVQCMNSHADLYIIITKNNIQKKKDKQFLSHQVTFLQIRYRKRPHHNKCKRFRLT